MAESDEMHRIPWMPPPVVRAVWWWLRGVDPVAYMNLCARCGRRGMTHWSLWGCWRFKAVRARARRHQALDDETQAGSDGAPDARSEAPVLRARIRKQEGRRTCG